MWIRQRRDWELPEAAVTPEHAMLGRRRAVGLAIGGLALGHVGPARAEAAPSAPRYDPGRPPTEEKFATTYNNYYEFSTDKDLWQAAQRLPQHPWTVRIEGKVRAPRTIALEDLLKQVTLEERIYRHRCVEAWAMTVPWTGFPLAALVKLADPTPEARYVVFETLTDAKHMPGLAMLWYPWPYIEGVTIAEATNELAFIATGLYGKPLPPQNGGPIRLVLPWKYGFKSAKALVKVTFSETRPATFWETIQPAEYGFWANVNPMIPHPRWSQASERLLGSDERVPTQLYNGYAAQVAGLYAGKTTEKLFM